MSREIKFRAWEKNLKEIITVYDINFKTQMVNTLTGAWRTFQEVELMQYTGLKDINGKEIYEGDIVKTHDQSNIIEYHHGAFMVIGLHDDKYQRNYSRLNNYLIDSTIPNEPHSKYDGITTTLEIVGDIFKK